MENQSADISDKIRSAIKAKLIELGAFVDEELPDYVMVMIANKKPKEQMTEDLNLFLGKNSDAFTVWLFQVLERLQSISQQMRSQQTKQAATATTVKSAEVVKEPEASGNTAAKGSKKDKPNNKSSKTAGSKRSAPKSRSRSRSHSDPPPKSSKRTKRMPESSSGRHRKESRRSPLPRPPSSSPPPPRRRPKRASPSPMPERAGKRAPPPAGSSGSQFEKKAPPPPFLKTGSKMRSQLDDDDIVRTQVEETILSINPDEFDDFEAQETEDAARRKAVSSKKAIPQKSPKGSVWSRLDTSKKAQPPTNVVHPMRRGQELKVSTSRVGRSVIGQLVRRGRPDVHEDSSTSGDEESPQRPVASVVRVTERKSVPESMRPKAGIFLKAVQEAKHSTSRESIKRKEKTEREKTPEPEQFSEEESPVIVSAGVRRRVHLVTKSKMLEHKLMEARKSSREQEPMRERKEFVPEQYADQREQQPDARNVLVQSDQDEVEENSRDTDMSGELRDIYPKEDSGSPESFPEAMDVKRRKIEARLSSPVPLVPEAPDIGGAKQKVKLKRLKPRCQSPKEEPKSEPPQPEKTPPPVANVVAIKKDATSTKDIGLSPLGSPKSSRIDRPDKRKTAQQKRMAVVPERDDDQILITDSSEHHAKPVVKTRFVVTLDGIDDETLAKLNPEIEKDFRETVCELTGGRLTGGSHSRQSSRATYNTPGSAFSPSAIESPIPPVRPVEIRLDEDDEVTDEDDLALGDIRKAELRSPAARAGLPPTSAPPPTLHEHIPSHIWSTGMPELPSPVAKQQPGQTTPAPQVAGKTTERCRYWPGCKLGEGCPYVHPTTQCKAFPKCRFGERCLFIHPNCKFDAACKNPACPYTHASKRSLSGAVPTPGFGSSGVASTILCRFGSNCMNSACKFRHPKKRM